MPDLTFVSIDYQGTLIPTQQVEEEWSQFMDLLRTQQPKRILEIGNLWGGGLASYSTLPSVELIVGVDADHTQLKVQDERWHLVSGDSRSEETLQQVKNISPEFDMVFIDGDHRHETVSSDAQKYGSLVRKGIVVFHDVLDTINGEWVQVRPTFDLMAEGKKSRIIRVSENQNCFGIGVIWQGDGLE